MRSSYVSLAVALLVVGIPFGWPLAPAQDEPGDERPDVAKKDDVGGPSLRGARPKIKSYDEVITKEAKTSAGLFLVHRLDDKVFFEIPSEELGKEMLWVTQLEQTQAGHSFGGEPVGDRVVRWEQRGEDVLLRDVKYEIRAAVSDPIKDAVQATSLEAIIAVFPDPGLRQGQAAGDRRDRGVHVGPAGVQRQGTAPSQRHRLTADVHREGESVPDEYRGQGDHDLSPARRGRGDCCRWACRRRATPTRAASP